MIATLLHDDCIDALRSMPDESVDSIVTDPPYELGFMNRSWDSSGIAYSLDLWRECLRVLKPGGHLLAFSSARTCHRMVCAIEDAGFEIRDQIMWVYGSGFPKSMDVSKAIDKAGGASPVEQSAMLRTRREAARLTREQVAEVVGCTSSSVRDWEEGRARSAGAPVEFIVPSEEYRAKLADLLGYSADERRLIGATGDRREDGTVYGIGHSGELRSGGHTEAAQQWQGWGTALKPAHEPICVARKPLIGTVAANVLAHGTGALNIDGCRVGDEERTYAPKGTSVSAAMIRVPEHRAGQAGEEVTVRGRFPANLIHDGSDEVLAAFPQAPGQLAKAASGGDRRKDQNTYGAMTRGSNGAPPRADAGSAARFFYCAKANKKDRGEGNDHPTVKPTDLMRYLCRLVTPPGGVVLDPFMGSGSTGKAAILEGFSFVGVEREEAYFVIAQARLAKQNALINSEFAKEIA